MLHYYVSFTSTIASENGSGLITAIFLCLLAHGLHLAQCSACFENKEVHQSAFISLIKLIHAIIFPGDTILNSTGHDLRISGPECDNFVYVGNDSRSLILEHNGWEYCVRYVLNMLFRVTHFF